MRHDGKWLDAVAEHVKHSDDVLLLLPPFCSSVLEPNLNSGLREVHFLRDLFPERAVRIVGVLEHSL